MSKGSKKAIDLLNDPVHISFYQMALYPNNDDLLLPYRIFFQLLNREEISTIKDNKEFWITCCKFFASSPDNKIGI